MIIKDKKGLLKKIEDKDLRVISQSPISLYDKMLRIGDTQVKAEKKDYVAYVTYDSKEDLYVLSLLEEN